MGKPSDAEDGRPVWQFGLNTRGAARAVGRDSYVFQVRSR